MNSKQTSAVGRPRTPRGDWGTITLTPMQLNEAGRWVAAPDGTRKAERWRARARVRDLDGKIRHIERSEPTKARAEKALVDALKNRVAPASSGNISLNSTVERAAEYWLSQIRRPEANLSESTISQYENNYRRYLASSTIANLTLLEANTVPEVKAYLQSVADAHGEGAAKTARSVLSGIFNLAVEEGILPLNAAHGVRPPKPIAPIVRPHGEKRAQRLAKRGVRLEEIQRDTTRAFTLEERDRIVEYAYSDPKSLKADMSDLIAFLAGTGVRIGEARALMWNDVDLDTGKTHVRGTKTETSDRTIVLPAWLLDRLKARSERGRDTSGVVFSSPRSGGIRDERNTSRHVRRILDETGFAWATSHTFRSAVASIIDSQGGGIELAANQLGHKDPSMTARVYLNRKRDTSAAAALL